MTQQLNIYMAGKISKGDWRESLYGRGNSPTIDDDDGYIVFPHIDLDSGLTYVGPYFMGCDHGCYHGNTTHGLGGGDSSICLDFDVARSQIFSACQSAICLSTNIFFAWIDSIDCYGTLAEIGFAHGLRMGGSSVRLNHIWIATPEAHKELWFANYMATDFTETATPEEALDYFIKKHLRVDYYEYIKSDEWKILARTAKSCASYRCQVCNTPGDNSTLHAHHRTYDRLGRENLNDITVLCAGCHKIFHDNGRVINGE